MIIRVLPFVAASVLAPAAFAADLPSSKHPVSLTSPTSALDWSGFYVGASVGFGSAGTTYSATDTVRFAGPPAAQATDFERQSINASGVLGGGYAGYNYQIGSLVVGLEGDISAANLRKTKHVDAADLIGRRSEMSWFGSARGRVGYTFGPVLAFVSGGVALSNPTFELASTPRIEVKQNRQGLIIGGGLDYAWSNNLIARLEYLHADFGAKTKTDSSVVGPITDTTVQKVRTRANIVRAGLAYKF